jgi:predicted nucleic-acid-binding Zn-ribbon protein
VVCPSCQAVIAEDAFFCSFCGAHVRNVSTGPTQRLSPANNTEEDNTGDDDIRTGTCPKCGSTRIIPKRRLYSDHKQIGEVQIIQYERPESLWDYGDHAVSVLRAWICGNCGYTELYANNYAALYEVYVKAREHRRNKG